MVPTRHFSQMFLLLLCMSSLPAVAAPATIRFKIAKDFLIVVPVTIKGSLAHTTSCSIPAATTTPC
jgi:hypothetical protein